MQSPVEWRKILRVNYDPGDQGVSVVDAGSVECAGVVVNGVFYKFT